MQDLSPGKTSRRFEPHHMERRSLDSLILALVLGLSLAAKEKPKTRHYIGGVFHGYAVSVVDRADPLSGQLLREVSLTARDAVRPYGLYGMRPADDPAGKYRLIRAQYARDDSAGCLWSAGAAPQGTKECTASEVREYALMLDHAIEDVVR
jgi:hypothetical protein